MRCRGMRGRDTFRMRLPFRESAVSDLLMQTKMTHLGRKLLETGESDDDTGIVDSLWHGAAWSAAGLLVLICVRAVVHRRRSILRDVRGAYPKIQMNQGRLKTVQICLYLCGCPLLLVGCISVPAAIGGILTQVANEIQQITTMLQFFIFGTVCLDLSVGILYYIPLYLEGEPGGDEPLETKPGECFFEFFGSAGVGIPPCIDRLFLLLEKPQTLYNEFA
jgi:hypothetical protein